MNADQQIQHVTRQNCVGPMKKMALVNTVTNVSLLMEHTNYAHSIDILNTRQSIVVLFIQLDFALMVQDVTSYIVEVRNVKCPLHLRNVQDL